MFRIPKWSIVAFVFLAVMTAFVVSHFTAHDATHKGDFASKMLDTSTFENLDASPEEAVAQLSQQLPQKLQNLTGPVPTEANRCQCTVEGHGGTNLEFETAAQCGSHRTTYEAAFAKMPAVFREQRAKNDADFPRACVTYVMNKFIGSAGEKKPASFFATCKSPKSMPIRSGYRPCVTENYVNEIYNSFADMTSCLGVPQRDYLPKLFRESGFHLNAIGSNYDAGISQMTGDAIEFANSRFRDFQQTVEASDSESCKRIAPYVKKFSKASTSSSLRCELISPSDNPLLNLFYMAIKYHQDTDLLNTRIGTAGDDLIQRMAKLGLPPGSYDHEQLMQIMMILSFNAGAGGAASNLSSYLGMLERTHRKLTLDDFNFNKESLLYSMVNPSTYMLTRHPDETDDRWKTRLKEFEKEMKVVGEKNPRYRPKVTKVTVKEAHGTYSTYKLDVKVSELSFPAYLQLNQGSGSRGYVSLVSRAGDELNSIFKEGTCVPNSYLAL